MEKELDLLLPPEMARKAEEVGVTKAGMGTLKTLVLAVLAGAFIALGAAFANVVSTGDGLPYGLTRLLSGLVFGLGLVLVILGGAELFTGNNLIVMAWASRRITAARLLRNWGLVFAGNAVGAVFMVAMVLGSGHLMAGKGGVGLTLLQTARAKCMLDPVHAFFLGVLCNVLVCLAVWLSFSAKDVAGKVLVILIPVSAFVACGFEHSIANLYIVPLAMGWKAVAPEAFWTLAGSDPSAFAGVEWSNFIWHNLLPVTAGNMLGGAGLVGLVYWFVYLRRASDS